MCQGQTTDERLAPPSNLFNFNIHGWDKITPRECYRIWSWKWGGWFGGRNKFWNYLHYCAKKCPGGVSVWEVTNDEKNWPKDYQEQYKNVYRPHSRPNSSGYTVPEY